MLKLKFISQRHNNSRHRNSNNSCILLNQRHNNSRHRNSNNSHILLNQRPRPRTLASWSLLRNILPMPLPFSLLTNSRILQPKIIPWSLSGDPVWVGDSPATEESTIHLRNKVRRVFFHKISIFPTWSFVVINKDLFLVPL